MTPHLNHLPQTLTALLTGPAENNGDFIDDYVRLNRLRDWVNANLPDFELYLEDVWNDHVPGETWIEYILRSRKTLNETAPIGYDVYHNHRDAKGVWHLDDYVHTVRLLDDSGSLVQFIAENE